MRFLLFFFIVNISYAIEPMSVDEFFTKYPEERKNIDDFFRDSETTFKPKKNKIITKKLKPIKNKKYNIGKVSDNVKSDVTNFDFAIFLIINRISDNKKEIEIEINGNYIYDNLRISPLFCKIKQMSDNSTYTPVAFRVYKEDVNSLSENEEKLIYDNHIYIETPGLNGFEHPIYDIKPIGCSNIES